MTDMPHTTKGKKTKEKTNKGRAGSLKRRRLKKLDLTVHQWIRLFSFISVVLMLVLTVAGILAYKHYKEYPGKVERDSIRADERGTDHISLSWEKSRNTDRYKIYVKESEKKPASSENEEAEETAGSDEEITEPDESWRELESKEAKVVVDELEEGKTYSVMVRGDNTEHEGVLDGSRDFSTKKEQSIENDKKRITKLTSSKPFRLNAKAETGLLFESSDSKVAAVDAETGEISVKGPGEAKITITARSSAEYESAESSVKLEVIEAEPVSAGGASAHIIYHLSPDNCEVVKTITGSGGAVVPQGLGYSGDKYIVSYGMGKPNRIISFDVDGDGKSVSVPKISLGHPNGFAYADENGRCYCVKGWSSRAVTYEPTSGKYGSVNLRYGCSGIGYDRKEKLLYTCSRTAMVAYDISDGYSVKYRTGVVKHRGKVYTQDCGGHAGILLRCLSGSSKHGTNYIDLYDMKNGNYLGTLSCDLSEVESCIVNKDGFLEILSNNKSGTDYIWRTKLNIESIGEGL